jgi:superfamily II DNA or RNA helicase
MILKDKIYINTVELGFHISKLCELFTHKNPEIYQRKKLKLSTHGIPSHLYHYKLTDTAGAKILQLPRGGLERIKAFYDEHKLAFRIIDQRIEHPQIDVQLTNTTLEEQQLEIINALAENEGGLVEVYMGGGKSIAVLGLISKIKQPTLIIVHEHRLSTQWMGEIKNRLSGNFKLGKYDGDMKEDGDIVVGIINSIYTRYNEDPTFFEKFGMVIVDETQHIPSHMMSSVVNNIPAKYRIGVTGTVQRKDEKEILTYDILGDIILKRESNTLKHRITDFDYKIVNTDVTLKLPMILRWTGKRKEPALNMAGSLTLLTNNIKRNSIIIHEAVTCIENGYFPLILSDRVEHNEYTYSKLTELGYNTVLLIGKTRKKTNWEEIRRDASVQCIVANTKIASEGLDLPRLSALLLTCPSSNFPKLKQQIARIRRTLPGKLVPLVIDFCDNLAYIEDVKGPVHLLYYTAKRRAKFYNELQKEYRMPSSASDMLDKTLEF